MVGTPVMQEYLKTILPEQPVTALEEIANGWMFTLVLNEVSTGMNIQETTKLCWKDEDRRSLEWGVICVSGAGIDEFDAMLEECSTVYKGVRHILGYIRDNPIGCVDPRALDILIKGCE